MVWPQMPTSHAYYLLFIHSRSQIIATLSLSNLERFICYHFCTYKRGRYHGSLEIDLLNKTPLKGSKQNLVPSDNIFSFRIRSKNKEVIEVIVRIKKN